MNKKRFNIPCLMLASLSLILVACSGNKKELSNTSAKQEEVPSTSEKEVELSKRYFQLLETGSDARITVFYEKDSDIVVKQIFESKLVYADLGVDKETLKTMETDAEKHTKNGIEYTVNFEEEFATELLTVDYSKADPKDINDLPGVQTTTNNTSQIGMKETAELIKSDGFEEITDGNFKELE